jgi:hypothetical protein
MDTCRRLEEPGGVGWKDVNVVRLRTTTSGKRLIWSHRDGAKSSLTLSIFSGEDQAAAVTEAAAHRGAAAVIVEWTHF